MSEWNQRELCPDGGCTGVIGPDGTCKVCGRAAPDWGDDRRRGLVEASADAVADADADDADALEGDPIAPSAPAALGASAEWAEREVCSDGACIGVLDERGVCKTCGRKDLAWKPRVASASPAADDAALAAAAADFAATMPKAAVDALHPAPSIANADAGADAATAQRTPTSDAGTSASTDADADADAATARRTPTSDADADADAGADSGADNRALCPDGACVGVIGANGKCKLCGKEAA